MITVYEQEKKDGLAELILAKASVSFDSEIRLPKIEDKIAKASAFDPDVYYFESVLASVGWNQNDDVFDKEELWLARKTPVHKKVNYMHDEKDIIGTMTKAFVLDQQGNVIPDDTKIEDLPDFIELAVGAVLYSHWEDKNLKSRMKNLISEISEDKWFVSMEAVFPGFDYTVSKGSVQRVIPRTEQSCFLTKHLKIYGGTGEYEGWKLGRQFRNITFSGKGIVNNPANKRSLITFTGFNGAKASVDTLKEVKMSVEQADYDKVVAESGVTKQTLETAKAELNTSNLKIETLSKELDTLKALSNEKDVKIADLEKAVASKEAKLGEVNKTFSELLVQVATEKRIGKLLAVGVESAKAEQLVKTFASADDAMFDEVVKLNTKSSVESDKTEQAVKTVETAVASKSENVEQPAPSDESDDLIAKASVAFTNYFNNK